jgi:threonine dehydrogenase-like Zn-dependent dehydrogenase
MCSICGTDVHIMSVPPGYIASPGTILGHELVGRVAATGDGVKNLKVGDRVVTNPNDYCGVCAYCQRNLPNLCENIIPMGIGADGGFAEFVRVSRKWLNGCPDLPRRRRPSPSLTLRRARSQVPLRFRQRARFGQGPSGCCSCRS